MSNHALRAGGFLGPEFNKFLFESIGTDQAGRPLSVVSALARLDLDAWAEAAILARLPRDIAADKLAAFIRKFTECPQAVRDSHKIAARLVTLLPERAAVAQPRMATPPAPGRAGKIGSATVVVVLILALVAGRQLLASHANAPAALPAGQAAITTPLSAANTTSP